MKIQCINNSGKNVLSEEELQYTYSDGTVPLIINENYRVYAVSEYYKKIWYCLCDESYTYYPMWRPAVFFEIADNQLSRYWVFAFRDSRMFLGFPAWANQLDFYDNLTDGDRKEVEIFKTYKELMDLEFSDPAISTVAQVGDNEWLICPTCIDAWQESDDLSALVRCSKCRMIMQNPRYQSKKALM